MKSEGGPKKKLSLQEEMMLAAAASTSESKGVHTERLTADKTSASLPDYKNIIKKRDTVESENGSNDLQVESTPEDKKSLVQIIT